MASKAIEKKSFENQINLEKLHLNTQWCDVNFLFESGNGTETIPTNKAVLAAESDVFAAMFYGEMKEKGDITVADASIDGFKEFLQFFYLNCVELTVEDVAEVMSLGHKYNVSKCVAACGQFLAGAITDENVCIGLSLAILYEQQELKDYCEKFIADHTEAVFKSNSFRECDKQVLASILKTDSLSCSETVVFEACMWWIKAKSKQIELTKPLIEEHLGELFYKIRFTSLTMDEFNALSISHDYAFSFTEYKDIVRAITSTEVSSKLFNEKPQRKMWNEGAVIVCNRKITDWNLNYWPQASNKPTTFESNQPILLGQLVFAPISIYNCRNGQYEDLNSDLPIDVSIIESSNLNSADDESTKILSNFKINLPSQKETTITLPAPVPVRSGFYYEIRLNPLESIDNLRYQSRWVKAEVKMEDGLTIKFHGDRDIGYRLTNIITGLGFK